MTPRVGRVAEPDAAQRAELVKTPARPDGESLNVFATLAHRPALLRRLNALGGYFPRHAETPTRERELVVLRVAARTGGVYVAHQHRAVGMRAGLTEAEIDAALDPALEYPFAPADRARLALADELLATNTVSDLTWARLERHAEGEGERLELLVLIGFYALMGGLTNALRLELDDPYV